MQAFALFLDELMSMIRQCIGRQPETDAEDVSPLLEPQGKDKSGKDRTLNLPVKALGAEDSTVRFYLKF